MSNKFSKESGSVTIEATISLSAFMFAIVTLLTIVNICIVQAKVSMAINASAKELSHYSYLYSLTGLNGAQNKLAQAAEEAKKTPDGVISDVNTVFTEIQNLGKTDREEADDITSLLTQIKSSYDNGMEAAGDLKDRLEEMAKDPKKVAFGLAKIAANDGWNLGMSRLIAAPLSKQLSKKNLVSTENGDVEAYLKHLGVKPSASGSYLDGLDFSKSTIFPNGSNEIRINVSYDVKVIALLPINFSFHFNQTAVTHGWLAGEESYRTTKQALEKTENNNIWTNATIKERADLIRHQGIMDYLDDGYVQVSGKSFQDVQVYNPNTNEFVVFNSMDPLYSAEGERALTLDDINDEVIKNQIEYLCAGIDDTVNRLDTIETKTTGANGDTIKETYNCSNASKKVVLTIPEDEGLSERIQAIIDSCNTRGVVVEIVTAYGNGARTTDVQPKEGGGE